MKKGLGRGLNSLFGEYEEENSTEKVVETKIEQVIVNEPKEIEIGLQAQHRKVRFGYMLQA